MKKKVPEFKSEDAERKYWATHSAAPFIDALPAVEIEITTPHRKREQIALPADDLEAIKRIAKRRGVLPQQLIRTWLQERLQFETTGAKR